MTATNLISLLTSIKGGKARLSTRNTLLIVNVLTPITQSEGLEDEQLKALVNAFVDLSPEQISAAQCNMIVRCLIPKGMVPVISVKKMLLWVFSYKRSAVSSLKTILMWIIGLLENELLNPNEVKWAYEPLLSLLNIDKLEIVASKLLYILTLPNMVTRGRVLRLIAYRKKDRRLFITSLLSLFKSLRPDKVPENIPVLSSTQLHFNKDSKIFFALKTARERLDGVDNDAEIQKISTIKISWAPERLKRGSSRKEKLLAPPISFIQMSSKSSHDTLHPKKLLVELHTFQEIGCYLLTLTKPAQILSLLGCSAGRFFLDIADNEVKQRFIFNLHHNLIHALTQGQDLKSGSSETLGLLLQQLIALQESSLGGSSVVTRFVSLSMIQQANPELLPQLLQLMTRPEFSSYEDLCNNLLIHVEQLFYMSSMNTKVLIIKRVGETLINLMQQSQICPQKISWSPKETLESLCKYYASLCNIGISTEKLPKCALFISEALSVYEVLLHLQVKQENFQLWIVPPVSLIYACLLSNHLWLLEKCCDILLKHRTFGQSLHIYQRNPFGAQISQLNNNALDFENVLFSGVVYDKAVKESSTILFEGFTVETMTLLKTLCDPYNCLRLDHHVALAPMRILFQKKLKYLISIRDILELCKTYQPKIYNFIMSMASSVEFENDSMQSQEEESIIEDELCGEENSNGVLLYSTEDVESDLSVLVNRYLPLNIKDDGKLPRTVCPGCNIQLQATVQFFDLLIEGQRKIRELWKIQVEREKKESKVAADPNNASQIEIQATRIEGEDGNIYMMITVPSAEDGLLYPDEHQLSLQMEGLEKPRRKRGRPPKAKPSPAEEVMLPIPELPPVPEEPEEEVEEGGRSRRRRRKVPSRYLTETIVGPEMDRMFREQGVIDAEDEDGDSVDESKRTVSPIPLREGKEVIGHLETEEGQDLGQLVVVSRVRRGSGVGGKGSGKGRRKSVVTACEICGKTFTSASKLCQHRLDHKWNYECQTCQERFPEKSFLEAHQESNEHTGVLVFEEKTEDQTDLDKESSKQDVEQEEDEEEEGRVYEGDEQTPETMATCTNCGKSFFNNDYLDVHIKADHEGQKPYKCDICSKAFGYPINLKMHIASQHAENDDKTCKVEDGECNGALSKGGNCVCDICGKTLNHPSSVMYHKESVHNNGRRFVCNKCGKSFKHKQLLQRHQLVHSEERPYTCKCGSSFKTKANLMNHLPTHTGEKKYFCDLCGQQFAHKTSLTLHYRWHTGEKPFHCNVCNKNFSQNGNLTEHMRIHTGEKPFCCNFCGRKFTTSSQFKLHIKRHTGERPWKCDICSKAFLHKDTWKCHVRRHRGERPFACEFCERGFTEQWALKKHLRIHTGEKPYSCNLCGKAFADCSNLTKHKKVHRGTQVVTVKQEGTEQAESANNVVWHLVQASGDEGGEGTEDEKTQHIIYVTYQGEEGEDGEVQAEEGQEGGVTHPNLQMLQQLTEGNRGLVLGAHEGQEVALLSSLGSNIPLVVGPGQQLQLSEDGENGNATLQMAAPDGSMTMAVTLAMEEGQLVAHIPPGAQFISEKSGSKTEEGIAVTVGENPGGEEVGADEGLITHHIQLVTEDGRTVRLVPANSEDGESFSINFDSA